MIYVFMRMKEYRKLSAQEFTNNKYATMENWRTLNPLLQTIQKEKKKSKRKLNSDV